MTAQRATTAIIRPKYGERRVSVRQLFRTRIKVTQEEVSFEKGELDLRGNPLERSERIPRGAILVPVWNGKPRPQDFVYGNIYDAIRGQEYTRDGYGSKNGEIASLRMSIESVRAAITLFLKYGELERPRQRLLSVLLAKLSVKHEHSQNPAKQRAAEQFAAASEERDSRGRNNPGARAARAVAGRNRLELRLEQIADLAEAIGPRRTALMADLDRLWTDGWNVAWRELMAAAEEIGAGEGESRRRLIERGLAASAAAVAIIDVEPYLASRQAVTGEIEAARGLFLRGRWLEAMNLVRGAADGIRFKRAGRALHDILLGMSLMSERTANLRGQPSHELIRLRDNLGEFLTKLDALDERRLERPVKKDAGMLVRAAQDALAHRSGLDWFEKAREYLKGALAYL